VLSSLLNLSTDLTFQREQSQLVIRGTAEDRNFAEYTLEAALASTPDQWSPVTPPSDTPIINDVLARWIPPSEGTWLVRLTAVDKAGNRSVARRRVTWGLTPTIANVTVSPRAFSPDGNGLRDTATIDYIVLGPVNLEFTIVDAQNATVRTIAQARGGAMIWSPLSNLLLYGDTADVAAAKANGVRIGIGSDWSPSGSKNLLGELKVAKLFSDRHNGIFTSEEIVAMATRSGAEILKWDAVLGSLEAGKRADLLVIAGTTGDPYDHLIEAKEHDVSLVVVNGVPRFGTSTLVSALGVTGAETVKIGSAKRLLYLKQDEQDPQVGKISLSDATGILAEAFATLPALARELEKPKSARTLAKARDAGPVWELALDEIQETGAAVRARLEFGGARVGARALAGSGSQLLSQIVKPLVPDPLTVAGDEDFVPGMESQKNLPDWMKSGLAALLS
jgi:hypothetical protein